jgi:hypothetical protein
MAEDQRRRGLPFYYPVASVLLLLLVVGFSISTLWGVVRLALPSITLTDYEYRKNSTFDDFLQNGRYTRHGSRFVDPSSGDTLTRDGVEAKRQAVRKGPLGEERRGGAQQVIFGLIAVSICLPLYLYHHGIVQRAKKLAEEGP